MSSEQLLHSPSCFPPDTPSGKNTNYLDLGEFQLYQQSQEISETSANNSAHNFTTEQPMLQTTAIPPYSQSSAARQESRREFEADQKKNQDQESTTLPKLPKRQAKSGESGFHNFSTYLLRKVKSLLKKYPKKKMIGKQQNLETAFLSFSYQQLKAKESRLMLKLLMAENDEIQESNIRVEFNRFLVQIGFNSDIRQEHILGLKAMLRDKVISELMECAKRGQMKNTQEFQAYAEEFIEELERGEVRQQKRK